MVVGVNWITLCQECRRAVFWAHYCSSCTLRSFFPFWKICWSVILITPLWWLLCHPQAWESVAESLIRDIGWVSVWCKLWGMKLNASKTKNMTVSRSRTMHLQSPLLTIGGTVLKESDDHVILGMTFDSKMTFEKNLRSVSRAAAQRLCILRKSWRVFHDRSLLERCFRGFVLPVLEYCSTVWCTAADTHLKLLDLAVSGARFLGVCLSVTLLIVDPWQYCVCCIRSGVTLCTLLMVLYLDRMCQCGLHAVLWSHIGSLMRHLAVEPRSITGLLFSSPCPSGTTCWPRIRWCGTCGFQEQGQCFFYWPKLLFPYYCLLLFVPFSSFCYRLVLRGWVLRSDRVYITLSQPCTADLF